MSSRRGRREAVRRAPRRAATTPRGFGRAYRWRSLVEAAFSVIKERLQAAE